MSKGQQSSHNPNPSAPNAPEAYQPPAPAPNNVGTGPQRVDAIPLTDDEVKKILSTPKGQRVYPTKHLNVDPRIANAFSADLAEAAGLHAMAAELRGQPFDEGWVAGAGRWMNTPLTAKKVMTVVVAAGVTYVAYSGLAYVFRFKGGLFGKRADALQAMPFPQPTM